MKGETIMKRKAFAQDIAALDARRAKDRERKRLERERAKAMKSLALIHLSEAAWDYSHVPSCRNMTTNKKDAELLSSAFEALASEFHAKAKR